ncbi:MAG: hypothetical protein IJO32_00345 [Bacilli bacterium]|nr:hypothetical protein [Bacilli bacterium]
MEKINYFKLKNIKYDIEFCRNFPIKVSLSDNAIRFLKVLLSYNNLSLEKILSMLENNKTLELLNIKKIDPNELEVVFDIFYEVSDFFRNLDRTGKLTFDEMKYAYQKLKESNKFSESELHFFQMFIDIRKERIDSIYNLNSSELESLIIGMGLDEIKELKVLLGFSKKPVYIHLSDYSNSKKVSENYIYDLTPEEKQLDFLIDQYLEKKEQKEESEYGFSFYNKISDEFFKYYDYSIYIIETMQAEFDKKYDEMFEQYKDKNSQTESKNQTYDTSKRDLANLQNLVGKISDSSQELISNSTTINDIMSLDELLNYRNSLDENFFWLKKAITEVIRKMNQRIISFNECVANGNVNEKLKDMSLWQKRQLLFLRKLPNLEHYNPSNELANFTYDATNMLWNSIKEDELKEAQDNGFDTFDEYMLSIYENDIKDKDIIDFRQIYIINYYKNKINQDKGIPKK